ncbi:putative ribonuclease H-like domain-containing protein [Tanacetum coccineum]
MDFKEKRPVSLDKSKIECYNCHRKGHFARECRSGRNQGKRSYGDNGRSNAPINESSSQALVAQDGLGGYDWSNDFDIEPVKLCFNGKSLSSSSSLMKSPHPANDSLTKVDGYHAVPPPITENFLTPRADISFAAKSHTKTSETVGKTNEASTQKPNIVYESVNRDKVIIEDWNSDDEDDVSEVQTVSHVKTNETQTVKTRVDKIGQTSQKQGISFKKIKACFVCKSTDHLIKDSLDYATRQGFEEEKGIFASKRYQLKLPITKLSTGSESLFVYLGGKIPIDASTLPNADLPIDQNMPDLEDNSDAFSSDGIFNGAYDDENVACFLSQEEPENISQALQDESWVEAMQEELLQFKLQKVWILVDLLVHLGLRGKWPQRVSFKRIKRMREVLLSKQSQAYKAIRVIFIAFAHTWIFTVSKDVKSEFLYGTIEEEYDNLGNAREQHCGKFTTEAEYVLALANCFLDVCLKSKITTKLVYYCTTAKVAGKPVNNLKGINKNVTPLFPSMLAQPTEDEEHKDPAFDDLDDVDVNDAMDYIETDAYMQKGVSTKDQVSTVKPDEVDEAERKFDQLAKDEEIARKARIEADRLLAARLQEEESEKHLPVEERAKFFMITIACSKDVPAHEEEQKQMLKLKNKNLKRRQIKEMNEESKDPKEKKLKKRVVNEHQGKERYNKGPADKK